MTTRRRSQISRAAAGVLLLAILLVWLAGPGLLDPGRAANAAPSAPQVLTAGQTAAIQGADQLLLSSSYQGALFLPVVKH